MQIEALAKGPEIVGVREVFGFEVQGPTNDLEGGGEEREREELDDESLRVVTWGF